MSADFRILDVNRVLTATLTASSAEVNFPVTNLQLNTRSRVWRTTGTFVIDATNNKLDFNEGGAQITATLANATYTPTTLAAEIKSKMDASVGVGTYTVSYSTTTGKWTISVTGAATFNILWNTGTNTATSVGPSIGFPVSANSTGATTYTGSLVAIHTEESVIVDLGSALTVDSVAVLFDPIDGSTLSASGTLTIQANASSVWTAPSVSQALTIDAQDTVATHFFSSNQSFRFWRLKIVDPTNTAFHIDIPKLVLSDATTLTQLPEAGFTYTREDLSKIEKTDYGHVYADVLPKLRRLSFDYKYLLYSDLESLIDLFNTVGTHTPFCISLDSAEELFDKDRFFIYGRFTKDFGTKHVVTNMFDTSFEFEEVI